MAAKIGKNALNSPLRSWLSRRTLITLFLFSLSFSSVQAASEEHAQAIVVIIIDDLGNNLDLGIQAINLPGNISYAILPHTPNAAALANAVSAANKEVLLHAPMSNQQHQPLGPGGLTYKMNKKDFIKTLRNAIDATPHVRGVSNHMGSQLTTMPEQMKWLMEELTRQNLYFVDSRTSVETVAAQTAERYSIPYLSRNIFLDNKPEASAIDLQFKRLLKKARQDGLAVGIGHPYKETLAYLEKMLPTLGARGYKLALASEAMQHSRKSEALLNF